MLLFAVVRRKVVKDSDLQVQPVDPNLVRQLGRIGSNLNQLTRHVNTERQVDAQVLHEIQAIREQIHLLIESSIEASKKSARENHDS